MSDAGEWMPIGASYQFGAWLTLWARPTSDGWEFREGRIGGSHIAAGTPGGVQSMDPGRSGEEVER